MTLDVAICGVVTCLAVVTLSRVMTTDWVAVIVAQLAALSYLAGRLRGIEKE